MSVKTGSEVEIFVYNLLRNSNIKTVISGDVYRDGYRPKNSQKEDVIVIFTAGLSNQIQTGVITVLTFVPDINIGSGVLAKNGAKTLQVEQWFSEWVKANRITTDYFFQNLDTINTVKDQDTNNQHFVSVKINYQRLT